jgi:hypothetical protein
MLLTENYEGTIGMDLLNYKRGSHHQQVHSDGNGGSKGFHGGCFLPLSLRVMTKNVAINNDGNMKEHVYVEYNDSTG